MNGAAAARRSPLVFFAVTLVLAVPFWILGTLVKGPSGVPMNLPWASFAFVTPIAAAVILVVREEGWGAAARLVRRTVEYAGIRPLVWYLPIVLFMPAVAALSYGVARLLDVPATGSSTSLLALPVLVVVFFVPAACEEAGWSAYAIDPLQARSGALGGASLVGLVWVLMHVIPWIEVNGLTWTVGFAIFTLAARIVMVWLYNNTRRSVLSAVLFHDLINVSAALLPYNNAPLTAYVWAAATMVAVGVVILIWGPRTLSRGRRVSGGALPAHP